MCTTFFWRWLRYASVCYLWGCWCNLASVALRLCHTEPKIQLMRHNRSSSSIETHREANFHPQYKLSHLYLIVRAKRAKKIRQKFQKKFDRKKFEKNSTNFEINSKKNEFLNFVRHFVTFINSLTKPRNFARFARYTNVIETIETHSAKSYHFCGFRQVFPSSYSSFLYFIYQENRLMMWK